MSHKVMKNKNDSIRSGGESKAPANVNSLRKLFENNFKLSNITNAFKSKSNHLANSKNGNLSKNVVFDGGSSSRCHFKSSDCKENYSYNGAHRIASPSDGCYLNCKIENCCCKTFFRQYNETPIFRNRPLPRVPLQERSGNAVFNRHCPERWSAASCSSYSLNKEHKNVRSRHRPHHLWPVAHDDQYDASELGPSKFYSINYEFYRSKSQEIFDETPVSAVSTKRLKPAAAKTGRSINLFEKIIESEIVSGSQDDDNVDSNRSNSGSGSLCKSGSNALPVRRNTDSGFVEFSATSLNEGGYAKAAEDLRSATDGGGAEDVFVHRVAAHKGEPKDRLAAEERALLRRIDSSEKNAKSNLRESEPNRVGGFTFKYRVPKLKNVALREHTHPYAVKKPRLTVKGVKNRNMRNVKRRQKLVDGPASVVRSQTFSGYDNFAYRRSTGELRPSQPPPGDDADVGEMANAAAKPALAVADGGSSRGADFRGPRPASISVVGVNESSQFHQESRMTSYNWPVTSFYVERNDAVALKAPPRRYSSSVDLRAKPSASDQERGANPLAGKTNLKRHCSLGYLDDEFFEYNFTRHRRSLDNVNKVSATCDIRNIREVNNKFIRPKKFQNLDIHVHALFAAVEHGYVEKTKTILESSEVDVNSVNSDGLSPLDVAVLSNNKPLAKLLVAYGAQEGRKFYSADNMRNHLYHLLHEAECRVQELGTSIRLNIESDQPSLSSLSFGNIPSIMIEDTVQNKTYLIWERRAKGLKRMLMGFEQIRPPDLPAVVTIEVTSTSSIMVYFSESDDKDSSITTKFKVQCSTDEDFSSLCGHYEVADTRQLKYSINNLHKGQSYYVRVASGNVKGYSAYKLSTPSFVVPSSWLDIAEKDIRFSSSMRDMFDSIFTNVVVTHPYLKINAELSGQDGELLANQRRKKTSIKQLFTAASKFQKHLRRGVYLACILYHEDKVLVTNEDFLPVIEVDENHPKKIHNDFHWFFKVAFSWKDLKWLKNDLEKSENSSAMFRIKLLQAAAHMQTALSSLDLGKLYNKMLRDVEGTTVISVINYIHSPKSISVFNLRWIPLSKLTKRASIVNFSESNVADILRASISEQITYHQVSKIKLPRGLYLSYLKMRSSVDSLQVLVPSRMPNIPPHCKVRDNPHVTAEEWEWLVQKKNLRESLVTATYQQRLFIDQIVITARRLFAYMEVPDAETFNHRLYDSEVIEVNKDVSLIVIVPPAETSCSMPGQRELLLRRSDMLPLTVQVFEMVHFGTYRSDLISMYSKLSCIIEMDKDIAHRNLRTAFDTSEMSTAKNKLNELETLHAQLNAAWKKSRWLLDAISFARERLTLSPTTMRQLLNVHPKCTLPSTESHHCLPPPYPKTAKSRGSWSGVGIDLHLGRMPNEISRSEQLLMSESFSVTSAQITTTNCSSSDRISNSLEGASENEDMNFITHSTSVDSTEPVDRSRNTEKDRNSLPGNSFSGSTLSISSHELSTSRGRNNDDVEDENCVRGVSVPSPAVIEIYAAYNTGLDSTKVRFKFHVSPRTTVRDIVDMFVKQTNMSVLLQGKEAPVYSDEELSNFCLVAVAGTRERCLRDDYRPVQLQRPWKNGRLYVRHKSNVLAAIERDSNQQSSYV